MHVLDFVVLKQLITYKPCRPLIADSVGHVYANFIFDEEWDDLSVTAVFKNSSQGTPVEVLLTEERMEIPPEVLVDGHLFVSLVGTGDNGNIQVPTASMAMPVRVYRSGDLAGVAPDQHSPELWAQALSAIGPLSKLDTKDKRNLVAAINEALKAGGGTITAEAINDALGYAPAPLSAVDIKVQLPQDENNEPVYGTVGQIATSDGKGGIRWADDIKTTENYITPQKFGAKADGVTDDSTAIQAAVDACNAAGGGTVFFPKGTYLISTAITAYGNQHFIGERGAVLLLAANSAAGFMTINAVSDLLIEAMTFDAGEGQQAKTDLIPVTGSADVTFKNCDFVHGFENLDQGLAFVLVNESSNFQVQNCRFAPDANDGVTAPSTPTACVVAKATDRVIVKDCLFDHADVAMNADAYSTDILVIGNVILDSYIGFNVNDGKQGITCLAINNVMNGKFENLYTFATVVGQGNRVNLCKYSADEPDPTDTAFFDLSSTGALSLKPEYRGAAPDNSYTYAVSDQGVGKEGSLILSLPERIVLPRLIGGKTVMSYQQGMFCGNSRVKEIVVLDLVKAIPEGFCDGAKNLRAVENTDRTTTVGANAFRDTRIGQALFPKLASAGLGANAFQRCMYLEVADLGTTLTKIPDYCFANCLNLKMIKNGTKVKSLGAYAFRGAFSLKTLPFMNKLTSLGNYACFNSRIQNWSELKSTAKLGSFATPIADNRTDYWTGSTFAACETPLTTALNQRNPKWVSKKVGNMTFDYTEGCGMLAMMHVHSALSGRQYNTPQEFELELKAIDPSLLNLSPTDPENYPIIMEALGYTATKIKTTIDQNILNELYAALAEGGCAIIGMSGSGPTDSDGDGVPDSIQNGNHAVIIYGVNEDGEVMVLDSDTGAHLFEAYEDRRLLTYQVPFQNITGTNTKITIVEKKS